MDTEEHTITTDDKVDYPPRNFWKASVRREGDFIVKDYGRNPFLARQWGRFCIRREMAALKKLEGVEGIPSFQKMPTRYALKMKAVPGAPLAKLDKQRLDQKFFERLSTLFEQIHSRGVAHGDAHQRNILVHGDRPYLIDFSTSYLKGTVPVADSYLFDCFKLLDLEQIYKIKKAAFVEEQPPKMFLLYRVIKGLKSMKRALKTTGLILAVLCLILIAAPVPFSLIAGGVLVFAGEAVRIWSAGHLIRNNELTTSGPYAYLRDPLYLGRLLLLTGFCVMGWGYTWILLIIGLGVFFLNYMPRKHQKEMARLENIFGNEYTEYAAYTRSLLPRLKPYPAARKRRWRFDLFWNENKEQYLLLGVVILTLIMVGRYYFSQ